jgi:hypothetical protein
MFEDLAISAVEMLLVMFWAAIFFMVVWGTAWMHSLRHVKEG